MRSGMNDCRLFAELFIVMALAGHQVAPLADDLQRELDRIVAAARTELGKA